MKLGAYSVFDSAVNAYLPPFFLVTDLAAQRAFTVCCRDSGHQFNRSPECYKLFRIGTFDDELGQLSGMPALILSDAMSARLPHSISADAECINFGE